MASDNDDIVRALDSLKAKRVDTAKALAALSTKLSAYDKAIAGLSELLGANQSFMPTVEALAEKSVLSSDKRPLWEEAKAVLTSNGADMRHSEIVSRILARGILIDSPTPANIVHSAMSRRPDVFVRVKRGVWGLLSSHPALAEKGSARIGEHDDLPSGTDAEDDLT